MAAITFAQWLASRFGTTIAQLKTALGLGSCDNTADADKPVSTATQTALNLKLNKDGSNAVLPTVDPAVAGKLWNDGGTVKVSA